jgi:transposase-like protein
LAAQSREIVLSEKKKYRTWTVQQKLEIVLAGLRGEVSVAEVCREHQISETLFYTWREKLLEGGAERLSGKEERTELVELRKRVRDLERTLGRKTYELEILGNGFRTWE